MVDVARLRKELEFITAHPDSWNQGIWIRRDSQCGTTACLAGNTVIHEGLELRWNSSGLTACHADDLADGRSVCDAAAEILGLNHAQVNRLFNGSMSLRGLWAYAKQITNGEIEIPLDLPPGHDLPTLSLNEYV